MSDYADPQVKRVSEDDRQAARESLQNLIAEAAKLSALISRTLGQDPVDISRGFTLAINTDQPSAHAAGHGVGIGIMCNPQTGECIGVLDDHLGVSRPCTETEAALCLQCGIEATDLEVLPE